MSGLIPFFNIFYKFIFYDILIYIQKLLINYIALFIVDIIYLGTLSTSGTKMYLENCNHIK